MPSRWRACRPSAISETCIGYEMGGPVETHSGRHAVTASRIPKALSTRSSVSSVGFPLPLKALSSASRLIPASPASADMPFDRAWC